MKTIIAGSRSINDYYFVKLAIELSKFQITEIVSGCAKGPDSLGERYGTENHIPIKKFPANWNIGKQAGILRNIEMGNYAECLICIYDGKSHGSKHMIDYMEKLNKPIFILEVKDE